LNKRGLTGVDEERNGIRMLKEKEENAGPVRKFFDSECDLSEDSAVKDC
jgi:hypothetical protein